MKTQTNVAMISILGLLAAAGTTLGQASDAPATPAQPVPVIQPATPPGIPQAPVAGRPQLVFETVQHDFGRIPDTKDAEYEFKFVNKGDAALKFTIPFRATCGCTAGNPRSPKNPNVDQVEFAPGEEGFIKVSFKPAGKHGAVSQKVTVSSNDPQQPDQFLQIQSFVKTTIAFDPPLVSFGDVRAGEPATQQVKVNGPSGDFKVNYASTSKGRFITVKVLDTKPVTIDGEEVSQSTLELTFNGKAPRGTLQAISTIRTNNEQFPLADLTVMAEVVGDLQVLPPRVNVGIIDSGTTFTKTFRVNSRTGKPFKITKVDQRTTLPQQLEITVTPVEAGIESSYNVEVKGQGPSAASPISATLTLTTDNPSDKTIEVALNGAVRPPMALPPGGDAGGGVAPVVTPAAPRDTFTPPAPPSPKTEPKAEPKTDKPR